MKSYKNHISLILAIIAVLFSYQFIVSTNAAVKEHEDLLNKNYSIIAVSNKPLDLRVLQNASPGIKDLEEIDPTFVVDSLKESISLENLSYLKIALPKFYKISLYRFPNVKDRQRIEDSLSRINSITRVEAFSKSQNQIYGLLVLVKTILTTIAGLVFVISTLLMIRQMELWFIEHKNRMGIMTIFGASTWQKSAALFLLSFIDSIISTIVVTAIYLYVTSNSYILALFEEVGITNIRFSLGSDTPTLFFISLVLSMFCVIYVIIRTDD